MQVSISALGCSSPQGAVQEKPVLDKSVEITILTEILM